MVAVSLCAASAVRLVALGFVNVAVVVSLCAFSAVEKRTLRVREFHELRR